MNIIFFNVSVYIFSLIFKCSYTKLRKLKVYTQQWGDTGDAWEFFGTSGVSPAICICNTWWVTSQDSLRSQSMPLMGKRVGWSYYLWRHHAQACSTRSAALCFCAEGFRLLYNIQWNSSINVPKRTALWSFSLLDVSLCLWVFSGTTIGVWNICIYIGSIPISRQGNQHYQVSW